MFIFREWLASGALYALWALAFALTSAPQQAFNVLPPAAGLCVMLATLRGLRGDRDLGDFYVDLMRGITAVILPFCLILAVTLVGMGVPMTFDKAAAGRMWSWLRGVKFAVGCNDVFNRYGPYAGISQAAGNNYSNVDIATYSPIGRLYYVTGTVKF